MHLMIVLPAYECSQARPRPQDQTREVRIRQCTARQSSCRQQPTGMVVILSRMSSSKVARTASLSVLAGCRTEGHRYRPSYLWTRVLPQQCQRPPVRLIARPETCIQLEMLLHQGTAPEVWLPANIDGHQQFHLQLQHEHQMDCKIVENTFLRPVPRILWPTPCPT